MHSLELRWFVPGAIAERELRAFAEGHVEARTDAYLLGTGDALGIKRRGAAGLLEHKQRLASTPVSVDAEPDPLPGVVERWHKTWPERDPAPTDAVWAEIGKRRALRSVGNCRAELTSLAAARLEQPWLTFAVETAEVDARDSLLRCAAGLLRARPKLAELLRAADSCGYPAWLDRHGARWGSNPRPTG